MGYQIMFYVGIAGALLTLIISIIVFIRLNISEVIEDLTGFSLHKWVKKLKAGGRSKQEQKMKPITREIQPRRDVDLEVAVSGSVEATELLEAEGFSFDSSEATELLQAESAATLDADATELLTETDADETGFLPEADEDETELLVEANEDETQLLTEDDSETELLSSEIDETVLLNEEMDETTILSNPPSASIFIIERDVVIVHTNRNI